MFLRLLLEESSMFSSDNLSGFSTSGKYDFYDRVSGPGWWHKRHRELYWFGLVEPYVQSEWGVLYAQVRSRGYKLVGRGSLSPSPYDEVFVCIVSCSVECVCVSSLLSCLQHLLSSIFSVFCHRPLIPFYSYKGSNREG